MRWSGLHDSDVVVIPARNEEASIGIVVDYLIKGGFRCDQVLVVNSGCTDRTVQRALEATGRYPSLGRIRFVVPAEVLGSNGYLPCRCGLEGCDGTLESNGKGAAMYAAVLALTKEEHPPESRVFFLDGDITNPEEVDPIGCLFQAWENKPTARIAKLASGGRENEGILAFINAALQPPYNSMSNLAWPLCGQQSLRLEDLQEIPFPACYSVEVGLLVSLIERYGGNCFTQQAIPTALTEERHGDDLQRYTRMFTRLMLFLKHATARGGLKEMSRRDICSWNLGPWRQVTDIGVPVVTMNEGVRETLTIDALLPPIRNLI